MSRNPSRTTDSSSSDKHSSATASPSFESVVQNPVPERSGSVPGRLQNKLSRGSKDTLTTRVASSPIILPHSANQSRSGQVPQQPYAPVPMYPQPPPSNGNGFIHNPALAAVAGLTRPTSRPTSPFTVITPSEGSTYDPEKSSGLISRRSSNNLSGTEHGYDVTSDLTLEGLEQRWQAYQAIMKKRYAEVPFYRRWTKSKWILLFSALLLLGYSCTVLTISLGYVLDKYEFAAVTKEFHGNLIYLSLVASVMGIACSLVGLIGIFLENRLWLSWYTTLLWPAFALYVSVGYIAFRRAKNHLRAHLKDEWVHSYTRDQRLVVQRNLKCCGYQDPSYFGEYDLRCFPTINLPGCQHKYNVYEHNLLTSCWNAAFSIVPLQLFVMICALLCSNHVDGMLRSARPGLKSFKEEKEE